MATSSALPPPLKRLRGARPEVAQRRSGPLIAYPPDGARVELGVGGEEAMPLVVTLRSGRAPFTWFADGAPVKREPFSREFVFTPEGAGFVTLSVVDADGAADRVTVFLQ